MEEDFFELFTLWFPSVYDIKYMMRSCKGLRGGLKDVADKLDVCLSFDPAPETKRFSRPIGTPHWTRPPRWI